MNRVSTSEILYVEKDRDYLVYHTSLKNFRGRGTMKDLKGKLSGLTFSECTSGILVNLSHVRRIGKETVSLGEETLPLSRRMKKAFTQDFIDCIGGCVLMESMRYISCLRFSIQLLICEAAFLTGRPRREGFIWRLAAAAAGQSGLDAAGACRRQLSGGADGLRQGVLPHRGDRSGPCGRRRRRPAP